MTRRMRFLIAVLCFASGTLSAATFTFSTSYTGVSNSPFLTSSSLFILEDFEDGAINSLGLSHSSITGSAVRSGGIDPSGQELGLLAVGNASDGTFSFDAASIGDIPTFAGLVITSASGDYTFEAFNLLGASLGTQALSILSPGPDVFAGVSDSNGISKVSIYSSNASFNTGVDHLQYGVLKAVPLPSPIALLALPILFTLLRDRGRKRVEKNGVSAAWQGRVF